MKKFFFAIVLILIVTYVNFYSDNLYYKFQEIKFKINNETYKNNNYTNDYQFSYVKENENPKLESYYDIINSVYTFLNNGQDTMNKYCSDKYRSCIDDLLELGKNKSLLSYLNGFVHPYNSFDSITFSSDGYFTLKMERTKIYDTDTIIKINDKVQDIIEKNIKITMTDREKIKTIHDYIINNTKYDKLKKENIDDKTYHSTTAYGVLFEGYGICSGYSDAMAIFLNKLNIPNYKISNDNHIWNLAYIDNQWLHIDLTWDDPISSTGNDYLNYDYFLITTNELEKLNDNEHSFNKELFKETKNE